MSISKVLIIDDETDICFLLGIVLRQKNLDVIQSNNLQSGKEKLLELQPDILFLDNQLPDGSGVQEIKSIRKQFPEMKIILMSANDGAAEQQYALRNGADLFLSKPFSQESVEDSLEKLLE
jgi:DNA-binding response OmpR family regulator